MGEVGNKGERKTVALRCDKGLSGSKLKALQGTERMHAIFSHQRMGVAIGVVEQKEDTRCTMTSTNIQRGDSGFMFSEFVGLGVWLLARS